MKDKEVERVLKALANRRRLGIVNLLYGGREMNVGDIADSIKLSFKATSKNLNILTNAGILDRESHSILMYYMLDKSAPDLIKKICKAIFVA